MEPRNEQKAMDKPGTELDEPKDLGARFEENRVRLRAVACRMLGSGDAAGRLAGTGAADRARNAGTVGDGLACFAADDRIEFGDLQLGCRSISRPNGIAFSKNAIWLETGANPCK